MRNQVVPPSSASSPRKGHPQDREPSGTAWGALLLVALSVFLCLLSLYQWMELVVVAKGGAAQCTVSTNVDCSAVWTSAFASRVHGLLWMPVAGLGLVFALTCLTLSVVLMVRALKSLPLGPERAAVRITALVGVFSCLFLAGVSFALGKLCLTCLGTYLLTAGFAAAAWKLLPGRFWPPQEERRKGALLALLVALGFYLLLLYPGWRTAQLKAEAPLPPAPISLPPSEGPAPQPPPSGVQAARSPASAQLTQFLSTLSPVQRKALRDEIVRYRGQVVPPQALGFPPRYVAGPATAPVRVTEFADIRCSHCKELEHTLRSLQGVAPPGSFSVEPRWFPLASACNTEVGRADPTGVCCAGARALICLEGQAGYWKARTTLFEEQDQLTEGRVLEVASEFMPQAQLKKCMEGPETRAKLAADVAYASAYHLQGTPLVLVNGKEAPKMGAFLYVMAATEGNLDAPELQELLANP